MQETQTDSQQKQTDFDSFRDAQKEYMEKVQHGREGTARLLDCKFIDAEDLPEEYKSEQNWTGGEYLQFNAELSNTDREVTVVCPLEDSGIDIETALDWAGATEIGELAGKRVPIRHISDDVYRVENFHKSSSSLLSDIPVNYIKTMKENNLIEFSSGQWYMPGAVSTTIFCISVVLAMIPILIAGSIPSATVSMAVLMIYPITAYGMYKMSRKR